MQITFKAARINSGMTQQDIAKELHVSVQTVINWENGKTYPNALQLFKMSKLYGTCLDDFLILKMSN